MNLMNKLMKKRKMDNKGFSLVELIIVIAIMAILVGIVGTQVVPYIEKSRKAKDIQVLSGWCTDAMSAYSSNAANLDATATYTITISSTGVSTSGGTANEQTTLTNAFCELNNIDASTGYAFGTKLESKAGKAIDHVTIVCQSGTPTIELSVTANGYTFDNITSN